ncbi:glycoside hydrolase family 2 TIM barrel-domain containing protein [Paraflavisolibacter sp. H34]|uniref:glycoside hydrolase family 2 TIM barrel-domain containing protein n=1 Tax=Huijunlia imazamoxiresistens TaxID=3127457 RepID=UPI00301674E0
MNHKAFFLFVLFQAVLLSCLVAQQRVSSTINSNWYFLKGDTTKKSAANPWIPVSLPHTWNAADVMDDEPGYYRGDGWYKKTIYVPAGWKEKEVYLYFEGAAQVADVFVNGKPAGRHIGGYTAFSFPISSYLYYADGGNLANELLIRVNNSHNENVPPLLADFTFYGGIYRDVSLNVVDKVHFDADNHASNGVFISTPAVSEKSATVNIKGAFVNGSPGKRTLVVGSQIMDAEGRLFREQKTSFKAAPGQKINFLQEINNIPNPHLWSIEDPYLYRVVSTITDAATGQKLDVVSNPLGLRWFSFDADKGFFLNGKHVKLIGTSRHQDYKDLGNALADPIQVRDVELLKQMGGNFLRIAHYPQDPAIIQACDRLGILTSLETPIVSGFTETETYAKNTKEQHLEMIRQNFNHPSLIMWSYMNEMLLFIPHREDSTRRELYLKGLVQLARELEDISRKEDPARYTIIPNHGAWDIYNKVGLTKIPKLVGWNLYLGWYEGELKDFGAFLDKHHKELPDKPLLITEYGTDADSRLHSFSPVRFDKTIEYTNNFHQAYLKEMMDRPFVAAAMIWNLAEFGSERRAETTPHINAKGVLTQDRKPKDGYRFYQANLLQRPYLQIGSKEWNVRTGFAASESALVCNQPLVVFSNQKKVSLKVNGKEAGTAETEQGVARFTVPFVTGLNRIVATASENGGEVTDQADIQFHLLSQNLRNSNLPFSEMNISLGDKRFFFDEKTGQTWIPEQEYRPGSWGYVGGNVFTMKNSTRVSYGTSKNVLGTDLDPVYQTQRTGIQQFKLDAPDGDYEITLHFAELISPKKEGDLVFNLGFGGPTDEFQQRSFNVSINGTEVLSGINNGEYLQPERAVASRHVVPVTNNGGITVDFKALQGESILNGIQVKRIR